MSESARLYMTHKRQSLKHVQQWTRAAGGRYIETTALSVRHQHIRGRRRGAREGACIGAATTPEVDPQCRCFGRRESDFALQRLEECRALGPERVRLVALHASGSEEGLAVAAKWASSPGGEWGRKCSWRCTTSRTFSLRRPGNNVRANHPLRRNRLGAVKSVVREMCLLLPPR